MDFCPFCNEQFILPKKCLVIVILTQAINCQKWLKLNGKPKAVMYHAENISSTNCSSLGDKPSAYSQQIQNAIQNSKQDNWLALRRKKGQNHFQASNENLKLPTNDRHSTGPIGLQIRQRNFEKKLAKRPAINQSQRCKSDTGNTPRVCSSSHPQNSLHTSAASSIISHQAAHQSPLTSAPPQHQVYTPTPDTGTHTQRDSLMVL